jgi:hypothetical protein
MNRERDDIERIVELTDSEGDLFRQASQTLLARSFIIRGAEKNDELWDFAIRNIHLLEAWFSLGGMSLKRYENLGVISLRPTASLRARLGKEETCALLVLRLLFEEKQKELHLARFPSIRLFDFDERYRAVIGNGLKKTRRQEILRALGRWRLIDVQGDGHDPETPMILYPSIALTLDQQAIDEILAGVRDPDSDPEIDPESEAEGDNIEEPESEEDL